MEILIYCLVGGLAGFLRCAISEKGLVPLPKIEVKGTHRFLNLGILFPIMIGAIAGWLAPSTLGMDSIVAFIAGWGGTDLLENIIERIKGRKIK